MLFCSNHFFDVLQGSRRIFNGVLKGDFVHISRFKALVVFRGDGDGVDNDVCSRDILWR
ncbi:hypothetical protein D3C76_1551960 [compost metagenome]